MSTTITRKYIQRITKREGNTSIRQSGSGGGGGGVSQYWVDDNYVSKEFFNRLFEIHDENGDPIMPNDVETEIDNIQAMFGFWTNAYLSALGNNPGGGGAELTLASLADVAVQGVADGQALVWNATLQKWVPGQGGGIDITAMWAALAQSGTQQIDASHLGTALTGYATETWVGNQGYITGSALNGYATESWVGQNYLGLHATADAATKLATARTIWGRSFDGTGNVSGAIENATTITASSHVSVGGNLSVSGTSQLTGHVGIGVAPHSTYALKVSGVAYASTGFYSAGYVTALSDIRHKDVKGDVGLTVSEVANAPAVKFLWKDRRQEGLQVGSIAQYWQKVMPEAIVKNADGELTMSYGVIALLASIATARKVEDHERRIRELEEENKKLKQQLNAA